MADIISSALGTAEALFKNLKTWPDLTPPARVLPAERTETRYYLRLEVRDMPGVLAKVSGILGAEGISISSALQKECERCGGNAGALVPFIITTHRTSAGNMARALERIRALDECPGEVVSIPVLDEHEEFSAAE